MEGAGGRFGHRQYDVFVNGVDDEDDDAIAKQKPETKQNTNTNKFKIKTERKIKTIQTRNKQNVVEISRENRSMFVVFIPDVGPCPDRLASGVGVPPDENKRPGHLKKDDKRSMSGI